MPVRNGGVYLTPAIESILAQTFSDFEFLIIDDGSSDETPEILAAFATADRRIKLRQTHASGIVAALNEGVRSAQGEVVARMDADDIANPDRFAIQMEAFRAMPELVAIGSRAIAIDAHGRETGALKGAEKIGAAAEELTVRNSFLHPTMMFKRSAAIAAGLYRPACIYAEDYDLWLRLAERGEMTNLGQPLMRLRQHPGQTSRTKRLTQRAATAFARQMAMRRRAGHEERIDMDLPLPAALRLFLDQKIGHADQIRQDECKDLSIILRFMVPHMDAMRCEDFVRRLGSVLSTWDHLRLRCHVALARVIADSKERRTL